VGVLRVLFVALAAAALGAPAAGAQIVEAPEVQLPEAPSLPETPSLPGVPDVTSPPPPPSPPPSLEDTVTGLLGEGDDSSEPAGGSGSATSGGSSGGSGSSTSSRTATGSSSERSGPRTRFDRLPPRFERLLERILGGRDVAANLRRLQAALAERPELRARILRLVRAEIAKLERGGVTPAEQRRIERLRRVEALLERRPTGAAVPPADSGGLTWSASWMPRADAAVVATAEPSGERRTSEVASEGPSSAPKEERGGVAGSLPGIPSLPGLPDDVSLGTLLLVIAAILVALGALAFGLSVLPSRAVPEGRARHALRTSRSDLAFVGVVAVGATMLLLLVGVLL
jgi:hypothetical protein